MDGELVVFLGYELVQLILHLGVEPHIGGFWPPKRMVKIMEHLIKIRAFYFSGQIIATSHDLTPNGGLVREIPLFQEIPGWWNIIIWPDFWKQSFISYSLSHPSSYTLQ